MANINIIGNELLLTTCSFNQTILTEDLIKEPKAIITFKQIIKLKQKKAVINEDERKKKILEVSQ